MICLSLSRPWVEHSFVLRCGRERERYAIDTLRGKIANLRALGFADPVKMITSIPAILPYAIDNIIDRLRTAPSDRWEPSWRPRNRRLAGPNPRCTRRRKRRHRN
jgi:hypothetical protein